MGYQDKISSAFANWNRSINDYKIKESGFEGQVIRLKIEENLYGDETEWNIVSHDVITISLSIPGEIPLDRLRADVTEEVPEIKNAFLYDILPITGASQFEDNIEQGDILIHKIYTERDKDAYYLLLKISELTGNISVKHLIKKSFNCAPYNGALPQKVQDIIDSYLEDEDKI
jgi:hypothetical protein